MELISIHIISYILLLNLFLVVLSKLDYGKYSDLKIYIYDSEPWKEITTASLTKRNPLEILEPSLNNGAGPLMNIEQGMYHTDQYQLFLLFYYRLLKDPRRTLNPNEATTFFIPYDFSNDCAYYKKCSKTASNSCFDFRKCPLAPKLEILLNNSKYFHKNLGKDHLLIVGMNYAMDHYIGKPNCKSLLRGICRNCTKLAIDDYSFMYGDDAGIQVRGDNWHAIPFPADFHWTRYVQKPFVWQKNITERKILVSYVGSSRSDYSPARRIRGSIIHYCEKHKDLCVHLSYGMNGTRSSSHIKGYNPLQLSSNSIFCFQPIGDLMTRKGLFDSLLQGCIPVVFDPLTARVMYTWHWDESFWKDILIEYSFHPVAHRYFDVIDALNDLYVNHTSEIIHKLNLIQSKVFELQYSLDGRFENNSNGKPINWPLDSNGNPMRDGYDIAMDHVLGWHSGREIDYRNATVPECWNGSELNVTINKCVPEKKNNNL